MDIATWEVDPDYRDDDARPDGEALETLMEFVEAVNIADMLGEGHLAGLGDECVREYELDDQSRKKWVDDADAAIKLAILVTEKKNWPIEEGSSNVKYPLLTTASLQFAARAYPAIVDGAKVVKAQITGDDTGQPVLNPQTGEPLVLPGPNGVPLPQWAIEPGAKRDRGDRVAEHMSWQLLNQVDGWEDDMDLLLHQVPVTGCAFKKVYYDPIGRRPIIEYVNGLDLVVNHPNTRSMETCPRISHRFERYPYEIKQMQSAGIWCDCELSQSDAEGEENNDAQAPHQFIEQHRYMDLDEDGLEEPYIVTVHLKSKQIMRIVANYAAEDVKVRAQEDGGDVTVTAIERRNYFVKYDFIPNPDGGFYGMGFGTLLRSINETVNSSLNQMLDAGTMQNAGGGWVGTNGGVWSRKDEIRVRLGVYQRVRASGEDIRRAIVPHEFPGPSAAMFQLLGLMIEAGKEVASIKDVLAGDAPPNQPATTTLALIEQGMTAFTAIYNRIHRAFKRELQLLFQINTQHLDEQVYFNVLDTRKAVAREDYALGDYDIMPVSDPRLVSDQERKIRAQLLLELQALPTIDAMAATERFLRDMRFEDPQDLLAKGPPPSDPLNEMKAFKEFNVANKVRAETVATITQALKNLADAEKAEEGTQIPEYIRELERLRAGLMEQQNEPQDQARGMGGLEAVPNNAGIPGGPAQVGQTQVSPVGNGAVGGGGGLPDGSRPYARDPALDQ